MWYAPAQVTLPGGAEPVSQAREEWCGPGDTTEGPVTRTGNKARDRLNQSGLPLITASSSSPCLSLPTVQLPDHTTPLLMNLQWLPIAPGKASPRPSQPGPLPLKHHLPPCPPGALSLSPDMRAAFEALFETPRLYAVLVSHSPLWHLLLRPFWFLKTPWL